MSPTITETMAAASAGTPQFLGAPPETAAIWVTLLIGLGQIAIIITGLWQMGRASASRDRQNARLHEESMTALQALIRGAGLQPPGTPAA